QIWKTGFLDNKALVAPKVNDLYTRKSQHVTEKFKRMFRFNLKAIVVGGVLGLVGMFMLELPITAVALFITLAVVYIVNRRELNDLEKVDKCLCSYDYLLLFDGWLKAQVSLNARMAKFYYPFIFLGSAMGLWLSNHGPRLYEWVVGSSTTGWQINGIPAAWLIPVGAVTLLLWHFGDRLYRMELNAFYGRVMSKLEELLADIETLRRDNHEEVS
ncbi:MAG: hypothetical protein AB3N33_12745, partial [Puniceicoccaceae bacterium]